MDPKIWGSCLWTSLFSIAMGYPDNPTIDDQSNYQRFFEHLRYVLPCESCKVNYVQHIRSNPIHFYLYNREVLIDWLVIILNEVNRTLGKPVLTRDQALIKYLYGGVGGKNQNRYIVEGFNNMNKSQNFMTKNVFLIVLLVAIIFLIYYRG